MPVLARIGLLFLCLAGYWSYFILPGTTLDLVIVAVFTALGGVYIGVSLYDRE